MLGVYVTGVVLFVGYLIAGGLASDLEYRSLVAILDPFGSFATDELTRYWTISEKNSLYVPLTGVFLWNRLLWTSVGLVLLGLCYRRFSFSQGTAVSRKARKKVEDPEAKRRCPLRCAGAKQGRGSPASARWACCPGWAGCPSARR